jgi:hypothetical protein
MDRGQRKRVFVRVCPGKVRAGGFRKSLSRKHLSGLSGLSGQMLREEKDESEWVRNKSTERVRNCHRVASKKMPGLPGQPGQRVSFAA